MSTLRKTSIAAATLALALGASACGSSGGSSQSAPPPPAPSAAAPMAQPTPVADIPQLTGENTAVALDQGFVDALTSLKVTPGVVGEATMEGTTVTFPITAGNVTYFDPASGVTPYVQGMIEHSGSGLSLTAGGKKVELTDFVVDPGASVLTGKVTVDGTIAAPSANLFFLDGTTLKPLAVDQATSTAELDGTQVKIHPDAAALLNQTFMTTGVPDFLGVGTATITVKVPAS